MTSPSPWQLAARAEAMNPSAIREILKITERHGILNFAGGLPSPETFPVDAMRAACARVLAEGSPVARPSLQYAASEGLPELRQWVAAELGRQGARVAPDQVLITTGSQQGLDLLAKVLLDAGSRVLVETPTYLGALSPRPDGTQRRRLRAAVAGRARDGGHLPGRATGVRPDAAAL